MSMEKEREMETRRRRMLISWRCDYSLSKSRSVENDAYNVKPLKSLSEPEYEKWCVTKDRHIYHDQLPARDTSSPLCRKYRPWPFDCHGARYWPWLTIEARIDDELSRRHGPNLLPFRDFVSDPGDRAFGEPATVRGRPNPSSSSGAGYNTLTQGCRVTRLSADPVPLGDRSAGVPLYVVEATPTVNRKIGPVRCGQKRVGEVKPEVGVCKGFVNFVNAKWII